MAYLAGLDLFIQRFEGFLQWRVFAVLVAITKLTEEIGRAFRPVQLVQIDPVSLQAF